MDEEMGDHVEVILFENTGDRWQSDKVKERIENGNVVGKVGEASNTPTRLLEFLRGETTVRRKFSPYILPKLKRPGTPAHAPCGGVKSAAKRIYDTEYRTHQREPPREVK